MTAFAVVLAPHESLVTSHLLGRIGSALEAVTGARAGLTSSGSCALLLSPLHSSDPARPIVDPPNTNASGATFRTVQPEVKIQIPEKITQ